jgi:hypothetical protein
MPLITSTTNLKSLKYKTYTQAPYVITQIPDEPESNGYQLISGLPPLGGVGGNVTDFFRGGFGLPRAVIQDEVRIGKFLTSPQGLLFTGKQQLLSRIGVREQNTVGPLNDGLYNPLSTLASVAGVGVGAYFEKQTQRTYLEKLGNEFEVGNAGGADYDVNRLAQLYNSKILNGLAFNNKSLTISPSNNEILSYTGGPGAELGIGNTVIPFAGNPGGGYLRTGVNNNNVKKYLYTEVSPTSPRISPLSSIPTTSGMGGVYLQDLFLEQQLNQLDEPATVIQPNLFLNIGDTVPSALLFNPESVIKTAPVLNLSRIVGNFGVSKQYVLAKGSLIPEGSDIQLFNTTYNAISEVDGRSTSTNAVPYNNTAGNITSNGALTYTQDQLINASNALVANGGAPTNVVGNNQYNTILRDFRRDLYASLKTENGRRISNTISAAPDYTTKNIENRVNLGNPGSPTYNRFDYSKGIDYNNKGINALDTINAFPIYRAENVDPQQTDVGGPLNDLIKFRIAAINNDNPSLKDFMHFRAFLNSFVDNYNPEWNSISYVGRGDKLYTYSGFTRQVTLSWTVIAQSVQELLPMYKKLNYLASNTMPDYSSAGYMRGPLIELTVGAYLFDQPGFISSLTYAANFDAGWEIGIGVDGESAQTTSNTDLNPGILELPKMIDVSMTFTPIPEFLARKPVGTLYTSNKEVTETDAYKNRNANKRDVNFRPDQSAGLGPEGYLVYQEENYIALTRKGNTFRNY